MSAGLALLLERAKQARDAAISHHARCSQAVQQAQAQEAQLLNYRLHYQSRAPHSQGLAVFANQLHEHHRFMQRLDQAVQQQHQRRQALEREASQAQQTLLMRQLALASLERLAQRRQAQAAKASQRREQKLSDEWSQNLGRTAHHAGEPWR